MNATQTRAIIDPLEQALPAVSQPDGVTVTRRTVEYADFWDYEKTSPPGPVGIGGRLGSRLLDGAALTGDSAKLKTALATTTDPGQSLLGHLVAGPGPRQVQIPGGSNAVLPAWRKAYAHIGEFSSKPICTKRKLKHSNCGMYG